VLGVPPLGRHADVQVAVGVEILHGAVLRSGAVEGGDGAARQVAQHTAAAQQGAEAVLDLFVVDPVGPADDREQVERDRVPDVGRDAPWRSNRPAAARR
jgi:hypothetical protein